MALTFFRMFRTVVAGLSIALGTGAVALAGDMSPFLGKWDAASDNCGFPQGDGIFIVEPNRIRFYEAICDLTNARAAGVGAAVIADMTCEGEGSAWTETVFFARSDETNLLLYYGSGYGFLASQCRQ